jgi:hypothetical protein
MMPSTELEGIEPAVLECEACNARVAIGQHTKAWFGAPLEPGTKCTLVLCDACAAEDGQQVDP